MPHAVTSSDGVASVEAFRGTLHNLLQQAQDLKPHGGIEPSLTLTSFGDSIVDLIASRGSDNGSKEQNAAATETALRQTFYEILATTDIETPGFSSMWSLLDITTILSDNDICEFNLPFWLVEELLESQTLEGCRTIFDYLESRRAIMVAKHYNKKYLTILRACNDLLKRLSRAEDTVFCGRVFIYLFSTLTFGDRSSVNLRGEFHVANTTAYDDILAKPVEENEQMELDMSQDRLVDETGKEEAVISVIEPDQETKMNPENQGQHRDGKQELAEKSSLDNDTLYPTFWSLQEYFSKPNSLFEPQTLAAFRKGLESTLQKFKEVQKETDAGSISSHGDENRPILKRKWQADEDTSKVTFNPKYLTSRDLFELEISDLAFRRHILVQSLILIDFLLSQAPNAKTKLENMKNKSVIYSFTLDDEQIRWAENMRAEIAAYLQQGVEGKFYYRMVDTVLSRDKNWVYWKAESCPLFSRPPVAPAEFSEAKNGAKRASILRKPRNNPLGALDLGFLSESTLVDGLEKLKNPERYKIPEIDFYKKQIDSDTLDLDFATDETEKENLLSGRASKTWRTLRIAARSRFEVFDKIEDGQKLDMLFTMSDIEKPDHMAEDEENKTELDDNADVPSAIEDATMTDGNVDADAEALKIDKEADHVEKSQSIGELAVDKLAE